MVDAYPLNWPTGWKRTQWPQPSRFGNHSLAYAMGYLMNELKRLGASHIVVNTNLTVRKTDGLPKSGQRQPDDRGVAVYFRLYNENQCIPCDKWNRIECNIWAIAKSVEALRGLERWGAKEMVKASFQGFKALPETATQPKVDYFSGCVTKDECKSRFRDLSKTLHPDQGGDGERFAEMLRQYDIKKNAPEGQ